MFSGDSPDASQVGEEELNAQEQGEYNVLNIIALLCRVNPYLRCHFVNLQVHGQKYEIPANEGTETQEEVLNVVLRFDYCLEYLPRGGGDGIAVDVDAMPVQ